MDQDIEALDNVVPRISGGVTARRARREATAAAYYHRTGHCHGCGDPGGFCTCRPSAPCDCRHLHPMGSAFAPDALAKFADSDDQEALW